MTSPVAPGSLVAGGPGTDQGRQRDEAFSTLLRSGDPGAFGLLFDAWADPVYDRLSNRGFTTADASRLEGDSFMAAHRRMAQPGAGEPFRVVVLRATSQAMAASDDQRVDLRMPVGPYAEDRLTRSAEVATLAADPAVAGLLWEAAEVLGLQVREVLDLHYRHHLTAPEVAAVMHESPASIEAILSKVEAGYGAVVRAKIMWRQGSPSHDQLAEAVGGRREFDTAAVKVVAEHLRTCESCRAASQVPVPPVQVFAAIPIALAPPGFKEDVVEGLVAAGVAMVGSASSRPAGRIVESDSSATRTDRSAGPGAGAAAGAVAWAGGSTLAPPPADSPSTDLTPRSDPDERQDDAAERPDDPSPQQDPIHDPTIPAVVAGAAAAAAVTGVTAAAAAAAEATPSGSSALGPSALTGDRTSVDSDRIRNRKGKRDNAAEAGLAVGLAAFAGPAERTAEAAPAYPGGADGSGGSAGGGDASGGGSHRSWIIAGVAAVAVIAVLGVLVLGGGSKHTTKLATADQHSTTTTAEPSSTVTSVTPTTATATTAAPTTTAAATSSSTSTTAKVSTSTTVAATKPTSPGVVTTTTSPNFPGLVRSFTVTGQNPILLLASKPYWDMTAGGAPNLSWSATASTPITVTVSGPGFSSSAPSGSSSNLCPGTVSPGTSDCYAAPGSYRYTLTVADGHGHTIPETLVLTVELKA